MSTTSAPDVAIEAAVARLKKTCQEAYAKYMHSCSHSVWHIRTQLVEPYAQYREANQLIDELIAATDWKEVALEDGWALAQKGKVVIGGLKKTGHGHVIAIYPGEKKASGGYAYSHKDKTTGKIKSEVLRSHGIFPRALSTALGPWPGAKSIGDKTVWDPWANDDIFGDVKFWSKG